MEELRSQLIERIGKISDIVLEKDYHPGKVEIVAKVPFPTVYGTFTLYGICDWMARDRAPLEQIAVVHGDVNGKSECPLRVHSECHTGDVWGSLRCDCNQQLEASIRYISEQPYGAIIYLKQEGRGIGLLNKIKAYRLQDMGLDTIEANQYLGFPDDLRDYRVAAEIVQLLKIRSVSVLTNNLQKMKKLQAAGVNIVDRISLKIDSNEYNEHYLNTKRDKMGHDI